MKRTNKQQLLEQFIYLTIWIIIFLAPIVGGLLDSYSDQYGGLNWREIRTSWLITLPFFLLFVANNYLLIPNLLFRKKYWFYTLSVIGVVTLLFVVYPYIGYKERMFGLPKVQMKHFNSDREMGMPSPPPNGFHEEGSHAGDPLPGGRPDNQPDNMCPKDEHKMRPPFPMPFISRLVMAFLLVGFNIGIKLLFKSFRDDERLKELEHEQLHSELEYLKYQINPHFFMNTLNNIHALVDIDTEKAQKTILELSKMMRYILYEASHKTISLPKEIQFLNNYIELMKLRYTEKVEIEVDLPAKAPDVQIPPLLFISFVENAFKHGVSYQFESFVHISMKTEGNTLNFHCTNSCFGKSDDQHQGIGLENIRKRLHLLFANRYTLSINEEEGRFDVSLIISLL